MHLTFETWTLAMTVACCLAALHAAMWWRRSPQLRLGIGLTALLFAAAPVLGRTLLGPSSVTSQGIQIVHEVNTHQLLRSFSAPWSVRPPAVWLLGWGEGVAGLVAANRLLHGLSMAVFAVLLRGLLGSWVSALWLTLLTFASGLALVVGSSETWTPLIWLISALGGVAMATARQPDAPRWIRWTAIPQLLALSLLVGRRQELLLLSAAGTGAVVWTLALTERTRRRWLSHLGALLRRPGRAPLSALVVLASLCLLHGIFGAELASIGTSWSQTLGLPMDRVAMGALVSLLPTDLSFVNLPATLSAATPLALTGLVGLGLWQIVRRERQWLWLALAVLSLFKVYWRSGHGFHFEQQRYLANLLPGIMVLGAVGWRAAWSSWAPRLTAGRSRNGWLAVLLLLSIVDGRYGSDMTRWSPWPLNPVLERDQQINARFLWLSTAAWPDCAMITRSTDAISEDGRLDNEDLVLWGSHWPARLVDGDAAGLPTALAKLNPRPSCALVVTSLACDLAGSAGCNLLGQGQPLLVASPVGRAYRHTHFGRRRGVRLKLSVRRLRKDLLAPPSPTQPQLDNATVRPAPSSTVSELGG